MNFDNQKPGDPTDVELLEAAREHLGDHVNIMVGCATIDGTRGCYFVKVGHSESDRSWRTPVSSETRVGLMEEIKRAAKIPAFQYAKQQFGAN